MLSSVQRQSAGEAFGSIATPQCVTSIHHRHIGAFHSNFVISEAESRRIPEENWAFASEMAWRALFQATVATLLGVDAIAFCWSGRGWSYRAFWDNNRCTRQIPDFPLCHVQGLFYSATWSTGCTSAMTRSGT